MKNFLLSLVGIMFFAAQTWAQQASATLTNMGGVNKVFYGIDALVQACEIAEDGDIITLSTGRFNEAEVKSSVTIRGAGNCCAKSTEHKSHVDGIAVHCPNVVFEGIYVSGLSIEEGGDEIDVVKCRVGRLAGPGDIKVRVTQSRVDDLTIPGTLVSNSIIRLYGAECVADHCLIYSMEPNHYICNYCFIIATTSYRFWFEKSDYKDCVFYHETEDVLEPSNYGVVNIHSLDCFNNPDGIFDEECVDFTLTPEAQSKYVGSDGTQIGLYGGFYPFSTVLSYPTITNFQVDRKSTTDGKLGVKIEVQMPE